MSSQEMGLWLRVEAEALHLYEQATGRKLLAPPELVAALRKAEARVRDEVEARQAAEVRAQAAEARLRAEAEARQAAEAELARLWAEVERLRGDEHE